MERIIRQMESGGDVFEHLCGGRRKSLVDGAAVTTSKSARIAAGVH